jgi:uncharacterized protein YjbI with pentapeptide repeats
MSQNAAFPNAETLDAQDRRERAEKALAAANEAAHTVSNLYITFLLLGTYIGIIIASTTDEQLLRISPVTLPLLNVELPILGFYAFFPWLLLLFHFNLLLHFTLLARKLDVFDQFAAELPGAESMALRERLSNFPFVHMLIGRQHSRFLRSLLALMGIITLCCLPLGLLMWAQVVFLPYYHDPGISWGQQAATVLDCGLQLLFFVFLRRILSPRGLVDRWNQQLEERFLHSKQRKLGFWSVCAIIVIWVAAAYMYRAFEAFWILGLELDEKVLTAHDLPAEVINALREGSAEQREQALRKVLGIDLRGRDLRHAMLNRSILPKADLRGAQLQGAGLRDAQLHGADLRDAQLQGADLWGAQMQGADLQGAQLQGAFLWSAQMQGANLQGVQLQGAFLEGAQLQGADLRGAQLQGAFLQRAAIGGANFENTHLDLADLRGLKGSTLDTLHKAKTAAQCLSDEPPLANCFTQNQLAAYRQTLKAYLLELACGDFDLALGVIKRARRTADADLATALLQKCEAVRKMPEVIKKPIKEIVKMKQS